MKKFQGTFETRKRSFISAFSTFSNNFQLLMLQEMNRLITKEK